MFRANVDGQDVGHVVFGHVLNTEPRDLYLSRVAAISGGCSERVDHGTALVGRAGQTMTEVVGSIARVTSLMGELSATSPEQASRVAQLGDAVTQMNQVTQQNAALAEEMAAAASSLNSQAQDLVQAVAVFVQAAGDAPASAPAPAKRAVTSARWPASHRLN